MEGVLLRMSEFSAHTYWASKTIRKRSGVEFYRGVRDFYPYKDGSVMCSALGGSGAEVILKWMESEGMVVDLIDEKYQAAIKKWIPSKPEPRWRKHLGISKSYLTVVERRSLMKVEGIDHIHIIVRDLDKAVAFYENVFGVKFIKEMNAEQFKSRIRFGLLGNVALEMGSPYSPDTFAAKFLEQRGEGIQALSVKVADIEEAKREMKARGIRQVAEAGGRLLKEAHFHPKDCFGVLFELCEYEQTPPIAVPVIAERGHKP